MKTKNLFMGMLAMTGMLFATSCSQNELLDNPSNGDFVSATFTIGTSDNIGTRAADPIIGKGVTVNYVACAVYDENGDEMNLRKYQPITNKEAKYEVRLAKGQKYRIVFFAYKGDASGNCDYYDLEHLTNITIKDNQSSNVEARDAFTKYVDINATATMNKIEQTVELKRPFAQLNLGIDTEEYTAAQNAGVVVKKSYIKVSNVYTAFNAYEDNVVEGNADVPMEFALNDIPTEDLLIDTDDDGTFEDNEKYTYLALNYLLAGNAGTEKHLTDVEFVWETEDGKTNSSPITFLNIPIQRNYRTNIYGKLLTSPAEFTIKIDEEFENSPADDYNINFEEVNGVLHATATDLTSLQQAINEAAAKANEENPVTVLISYTGNGATTYSGRSASTNDITISQIAGLNYIIDGCNNEFDGTFYLEGKARHNGKETLRIKNFNFTHTSNNNLDFISCNTTESTKRYAHNVSVENCTFTGSNDADVVGMRYRQCYNMSVKNCTFSNMHSLMWATGGNGIALENVTITGSKSGVSFGTTTDLSVENSNFDVEEHGIRADGISTSLVVKNTAINAATPIIVRNLTKAEHTYNISLEGAKLNATNAYHIVFTNGSDDAEYATPTGNHTITGADNYNVYPMEENQTSLVASSAEQITSILTNTEVSEIKLAEGTYIIPDEAKNKTLTFIGTGKPEDTKIENQNDGSYEGCDYSLDGATVTFQNVSINTDSHTYAGYARCKGTYKNCIINGTYTLYGESNFEECTFNVSGDVYNIWTWGAQKAEFKKCTFNCDGKAVLVYNSNLEITFDTCTFNDKGDGTVSGKAAIETGVDNGNTKYTINIKSCTVNGFDTTTQNQTTYGGTSLGTNVWGNKNLITAANLDVKIDDEEVY